MGAGVRGDMGRINEDRARPERPSILAEPFRGSGEVWQPDSSSMCPGRKHRDFFANAKSQAWYSLRQRFQATFRVGDGALCALPYRKPLVGFIRVHGC